MSIVYFSELDMHSATENEENLGGDSTCRSLSNHANRYPNELRHRLLVTNV